MDKKMVIAEIKKVFGAEQKFIHLSDVSQWCSKEVARAARKLLSDDMGDIDLRGEK